MTQAMLSEFETVHAFEREVAALLKRELQQAGSQPHGVLISGGRTPLPIYAAIADNPFLLSATAHIGFSDERHVPHHSPDSNYGAARPMLRALQASPDQVLQVETALPLEESAEEYDRRLRGFLERGGKFSLALLGIGADGHTCSLFTQEDLDKAAGHLAVAVTRPAPPHRVSITPDLLAQVERVIILVTGRDKDHIIKSLLHAPEEVVAGRAIAGCSQAEIWRA